MRFSRFRRTAVLTLSVGALVGTSACFGSFNLTRKLYAFNKGVSSDKFAQELVFLGLNIIPVYYVAGAADVLVANTIEFWTGTNPVSMSAKIRVDSVTTVRRVEVGNDSLRTMTLETFKADSLIATTTVEYVPGSHHMTFETFLPSGVTETHVVAMTPDGKAFVSPGTFTDLLARGVAVEY